MSTSPPLVVADRYRLVAPLGQGGMGRVWRANDVVLHRDVAIKELVPPPGLTTEERQEMRERSLREARAIARLNHVNVVRVFDVLRTDADPWIVMEYVASRSLHDVLAADGPYPPARAAEIGLGVLGALRAAHRAGVVHRDVKPGNVLIGEDGRVVLTDFGLATVPGDPNVTRTGLVLGSPAYIAPERARDGTAGPGADLWSLGATLYAAVEGASPFARPSAIATLAALATENPPPARNAGPLKPVLNGLLRKDPAHRINAEEAERLLLRATGRRSKISFPMSPTMRRPGLGRERPSAPVAPPVVPGAPTASGSAPVVPGPRPPVSPARPGAAPPAAGRPPVYVPGKASVGQPPAPVVPARPAADTPTRVDTPKVTDRPTQPPLDVTRVDTPAVPAESTPVGQVASAPATAADVDAAAGVEAAADVDTADDGSTGTDRSAAPDVTAADDGATDADAAQGASTAARDATASTEPAGPATGPAGAAAGSSPDASSSSATVNAGPAVSGAAATPGAARAGADTSGADTSGAGAAGADTSDMGASETASSDTASSDAAGPSSSGAAAPPAAPGSGTGARPLRNKIKGKSGRAKGGAAKSAGTGKSASPVKAGPAAAGPAAAGAAAAGAVAAGAAAAGTTPKAAAAGETSTSPAVASGAAGASISKPAATSKPAAAPASPPASSQSAAGAGPAGGSGPAAPKRNATASAVTATAATALAGKSTSQDGPTASEQAASEDRPETPATTTITADGSRQAGAPPSSTGQVAGVAPFSGAPVGSARPPWKPMSVRAPSTGRAGITVFGTTLDRRQTSIFAAFVAVVALALVLLLPKAFGSDDPPTTGDAGRPTGAPPATAATPTGSTAAAPGVPAPAPTSTAPSIAPSPTSSSPPSSAPPASAPAANGGFTLPAGWTMHTDRNFSVPVPNGWSVTRKGTEVYFQERSGSRRLLIVDQTRTPHPDPVADWKDKERHRKGEYRNYRRIKIDSVTYWDKAADWEFTRTSDNGNALHVVKRGFITAPDQAYGITWSTSAGRWNDDLDDLDVIYRGFKPARA